MTDYYRDHFKKIIQSLSNKMEKGNEKSFLYAFRLLVDTLEIARPSRAFEKYFAHPSIFKSALQNFTYSDKLSAEHRKEIQPLLNDVIKKIHVKKDTHFIRYRILAPGGIYPNFELGRNNCFYLIQNQLPIIWTKNVVTKDRNILDSSITNWLTRNELKLAATIMCVYEDHAFSLLFNGYNTVEADWSVISKMPDSTKPAFLRELFELDIRFKPIGIKWGHRQPVHDPSLYEFYSFDKSYDWFKKLFDNFSINDNLLLKTCNYFVKARMHWENPIYAEEAIVNNLFCIEGCLHLIQKKYGENKPKLNFKLLTEVFKKHIPHGETMLSIIKDAYHIRIKLVHPEPEWGAEWKPLITSEDFFENFRISRALLNFVLIDYYPEF